MRPINLPADKANHFIGGLLVYLVASGLMTAVAVMFGLPAAVPPFVGLVLAGAAGYALEEYQRRSGTGVFDKMDAWYTLGGGAAGAACALLPAVIARAMS